MTDPTFDRDGAPTEETLRAIREWPATDEDWRESASAWLNFVVAAWNQHYGLVRQPTTHEQEVALWWQRGVALATGGWSANEMIVGAMRDHPVLWSSTWLFSARGGLHVFRYP